jgi:hypothetical protein
MRHKKPLPVCVLGVEVDAQQSKRHTYSLLIGHGGGGKFIRVQLNSVSNFYMRNFESIMTNKLAATM